MYSRCPQPKKLSQTFWTSQVRPYEVERSGRGPVGRVEACASEVLKKPCEGTEADQFRLSKSADTPHHHSMQRLLFFSFVKAPRTDQTQLQDNRQTQKKFTVRIFLMSIMSL